VTHLSAEIFRGRVLRHRSLGRCRGPLDRPALESFFDESVTRDSRMRRASPPPHPHPEQPRSDAGAEGRCRPRLGPSREACDRGRPSRREDIALDEVRCLPEGEHRPEITRRGRKGHPTSARRQRRSRPLVPGGVGESTRGRQKDLPRSPEDHRGVEGGSAREGGGDKRSHTNSSPPPSLALRLRIPRHSRTLSQSTARAACAGPMMRPQNRCPKSRSPPDNADQQIALNRA